MTMDSDENKVFDAVSLIRKAQVDTVLDAIQLIVRLSNHVNAEEQRNAEHMVMRLQTMLRTI